MSSAGSPSFPGGFTVLMAVYGRDDVARFEDAVRSVFANSLLPDVFLLVVDGPLPRFLASTLERLESEFRFRAVRSDMNVGLAKALNLGLRQVDTEWVVRADADDFNLPDRFQRQAEVASVSPAPDLMGGAIIEVDLDGTPLNTRRTPLQHEQIVRYARHRNPFNHMTVAYRRTLALQCGGYPDIHLKEDYGLWALMLREGARTLNLPDVLVRATAGAGMYRRRGGWRYAKAEAALQAHLARCGLQSWTLAAFTGSLRATVFLLPSALRGAIYARMLRSSVEEE